MRATLGLGVLLPFLLVPFSSAMNLVSTTAVSSGVLSSANPPYRTYMHVEGNYVYIATYRNRKLLIFDVTDKSAPELVSSIGTCYGRDIHDIWYDEGFVYTGHRSGGLTVYDVSVPEIPTVEKCLLLGYIHKGLITWENFFFYSGRGHISIYDLDDGVPTTPVSTVAVPPKPNDARDGFETVVTTDGNYAYRTENSANAPIYIFNVSNKYNPSYIGNFYENTGNYPPWEMEVYGQYLYATTRDENGRGTGFEIYDVSNGASPSFVSRVEEPLVMELSLDHENLVLFVRNRNDNADIHAYDVGDPSSPVKIDSYSLPGRPQKGDLWYDNGYVYAFSGSDLLIFRPNYLLPPSFCDREVYLDPIPVNLELTEHVSFTNPGSSDIQTATWNWGDGTTAVGDVDSGGGIVSGSHAYTAAGIYNVELTIATPFNSVTKLCYILVVYNPDGEFVTGGGWFESPQDAYHAEPLSFGKATFGFVAKYKKSALKGASGPSGQTQFNFQKGGLKFHATAYNWLVVTGESNGESAHFKGIGLLNGEMSPTGEDYVFEIWAYDGEPDTFRVKIYYGEKVVYDNGVTELGGGSIKIHK